MKTAIGVMGALIFAASVAHGQEGDVAAGRAFVGENCRQCHDVGYGAKPSEPFRGAPAFRKVANMSATTPLSLRVFLNTPHPTMPNLILSRTEVDNVIAYIFSLRRSPPVQD